MASSSAKPDDVSQEEGTESECSGSSKSSTSKDPADPKDIEMYIGHLNEWLTIPARSVRDEGTANVFQSAYVAWQGLTELYKQHYSEVQPFTAKIFDIAAKTLKKGRIVAQIKKGDSRRKGIIECPNVLNASLGCVTVILVATANEFEKDGVNKEFLQTFETTWWIMMHDILATCLSVDSSTGCVMLDVLAALGNDLYCTLGGSDQKRLITFLLGYAVDTELTAQIRAKIGRCLAKLIEFPSVREDLSFFMDCFGVATKCIVSGESVVKISYAWTFSNLTDAMLASHIYAPLEDETIGFGRVLLHTAVKCTEVPVRGRYSACRACGNIYRWMKLDMLGDMDHRQLVAQITMKLIGMVGTGLDYKLRWNAAHALGNALENEIFFLVLNVTITTPIIRTLAKWVAQSQNYKERTQCVVSLMKAKKRGMYDYSYAYVWDRICLSLSRLPVEDCDNVEKFKIEAVLLIFHLISVIRFEDLEGIQATVVKHGELLASLVIECISEIPLERLDETLICKDNLKCLTAKVGNTALEEVVAILVNVMKPAYAND